MIAEIKLISRLMGDSRVSGFAKILPVASLIYLISPIDLIPGGVLTMIGAVDDIAVMWFGLNFFVELCPANVVAEHRAQLNDGSVEEVVEGEIIE